MIKFLLAAVLAVFATLPAQAQICFPPPFCFLLQPQQEYRPPADVPEVEETYTPPPQYNTRRPGTLVLQPTLQNPYPQRSAPRYERPVPQQVALPVGRHLYYPPAAGNVPTTVGENTVVISLSQHSLTYFDKEGGTPLFTDTLKPGSVLRQAVRYTVGVGRDEQTRAITLGEYKVGRMQRHPQWHPTDSMLARVPRYRNLPITKAGRHGYEGGDPRNPLSAFAAYLIKPDGTDSSLRIHGTNEPESVGGDESSGCFRMRDEDVLDLAKRITVGTLVIVVR